MPYIISDLFTKYLLNKQIHFFFNQIVHHCEYVFPLSIINYRHYSVNHNKKHININLEKTLAFWNDNVKNIPLQLDFPIDKKRPKVFTRNSSRKYFELSEEATARLKKLNRSEAANLYTLTLTSYALLLYKYSGQSKFTIGVPFTNSRYENSKSIADELINIYPVVADFEGNPSFRDLLGRIQNAMYLVQDNKEVPYDNILENCDSHHDNGFNPLFQYGFIFESSKEINFDNLAVQSFTYSKGGSGLDQVLVLCESGDKLKGYIDYSTDLFEVDTIARIINNYIYLLERLTDIILLDISKISILSPAERQKTVFDWNNTKYEYPNEICIHHLFEQQVALTPDTTALVYDDGLLSYSQFNAKVNQLANYLIKNGIKVEDKVGVYIDRSPEMLIAIYGILKAGAVYVPIDVHCPSDRLFYFIQDSQIKILLTKSTLSEIFKRDSIVTIELDTAWDLISKESSLNPEVNVNSHNLAYIIYTSGSTGKPKGVMIEHHSVINFIYWRQRLYPLSQNNTILLKTPIIFDISVLELFWWGFFGARLCLLEAGAERFPDKIIETVHKFKVNFMQFVPSMMNVFLEFVTHETAIKKLESLLYVSTIGEVLPAITVNRFNKHLFQINGTRLINTYGPTETTVEVSYFECTSSEVLEVVPIGKPFDNTKIYIVDNNLNPQPIGVKGELLIAGVGVARGYFNRAELTASRFIINPFDNEFGEYLYKTGDLARFLPDGNIEFLGRMDFQVKIRGHRIELGEIESILRSHSAVNDTVVVATDFGAEDIRLLAYVVPALKIDHLTESLFAVLKEKLPDYMVPSAIIPMDEFPALPNGKLDRKALPMPTNSVSAKEKPYLSPQTAFEKEIAAIWSKILKVEKIGMHDNFFELGGHSLLAAKMVVMVEKAVHRTITLQAIYEYSKLGEFLDFLNYDYQVNNKTQTPISEKLDDFGQLLSDLQNSGYTFSIRNARLFYESPNQIKNLEIERKIAKYYHQLFRIYWPAAGLNLAPIQPEGMADPFFIVHGEQSTPLLRDIFGKEQPLFDYFHQSCDGSRMKHKTVEEVAEMYLQQLLSIKSEGNFLLAGYSFGGLVAYEMAQRLINMGKKVNLLILIDTPTPGFKDYTYRFDSLKNKLKYYLINPVRDKITSVIWTIQCNYFLMLNKPIPLHLRTFYIVGNYERNEVQYKPQQYTGKLHLITAEDNFQPRDPYLGWWNFIKGGIELVPLPGDHREMVQNPETVKMMAFKIKEFIEEVKS